MFLTKVIVMPESYGYFKNEVKNYLKEHVPLNDKILDVGPGVGTYSNLLRDFGYKMDCIEIWEPYVHEYNLKEKYDNVFIGNIMDFDISEYQFIILGDVLEHLTKEDGIKLIDKIHNSGKRCLVAIPYTMEQGEHYGNIYESHLQTDLTLPIMSERYPQIEMIYSNPQYGYFISKPKRKKAYVLYATETYYDIVRMACKSLRTFSDLPIFVYLLDSELKIDIENTITINWNFNFSGIEDASKSLSNNFYIDRSSQKIYELLIQRPLIVKDALEKYSEVVAYVDSDSIATQYCDRIFEMYDSKLDYPYFVEGIYEYLHINGRGGAETREDLSTTLEHPACELFGANQYIRQKYRQTGYFVAGPNTIDFLDEWYWMCNHPKVLKDFQHYAAYHEETIANVLLWKYGHLDGLPYIYTNGDNQTIDKIFKEELFTGEPRNLGPWFKIPGNEQDLLFIHGEKNDAPLEASFFFYNIQ